jgi:hypothetical protein
MCTTRPEIINADLLEFFRQGASATEDLIVATPTLA